MTRRDFVLLCGSGMASTGLGFLSPTGEAMRPEFERIPGHLKVKPVFMVPSDGPPPTSEQSTTLMNYLVEAQRRYRRHLSNLSTFDLASQIPTIVKVDKPLAFFDALNAPDSGEHPALVRMFAVDGVDRYTCPYVYVVALTGVERPELFTGGTFNGGPNNGGGLVMMDAKRLVDGKTGGSPEGFLTILIHELGHAFGLVHSDSYGYSQTKSDAYMSYGSHRTRFLPEDLRVLGQNKRVFPAFDFLPSRDIPPGYKIAPEPKYQAGPMGLEGQHEPIFYPVHFRSLGSRVKESEVTVELWVRCRESQWDQCMFDMNGHGEGEPANGMMVRGPRPDGSLFWDFGDWQDGGRLAFRVPDFGFFEWQHFAFVVSRKERSMRAYLNGTLLAKRSGMSEFVPKAHDMIVGCGRWPFRGEIREFRVWDRARSASEIRSAINSVCDGSEVGLLALYGGKP